MSSSMMMMGCGTAGGVPGQTYDVMLFSTAVDEGDAITFDIETENVSDGTTLYWTLNTVSGTVDADDFDEGVVSGSFVITANAGSVVLTVAEDVTTEGSESFQMQIRTGSTGGPVVATSATVTIADTSIAPLLRDTFTDSDGTALASHTMNVGSGWTVHAGTVTIESNQASSASGVATATADALSVPALLQALITLGEATGNNGIGIVFRCSDSSNYWIAWISGNGTVVLYEKNGGSYTSRDSDTWTANTSQHSLTVALSGNDIVVRLDGIEKLTYSSSFNVAGTRGGLENVSSTGVANRFDSFEVTAP